MRDPNCPTKSTIGNLHGDSRGPHQERGYKGLSEHYLRDDANVLPRGSRVQTGL
ncbi:hypothetical protein [Bythopirellula goksoeyrii]|uniref:Uncharacterized protein n=1 Tax=Bythopirellula goksoeyrii TaxID=1400387 RepID=A0A5B9QE23_9BACT|nr:hypothetical protein [Bythopirellula goksoeyrii]QEG35875.1 hypothetical protein Pr1d_31810 [Bythopirellula goksoeyrii]